jgi:thiamine transport system permease protein
MTAIQAGLSTILSLLVGVALAWALDRLRFPGRGLVIGLFASAIVTPGLIIAFGLLTVWGRSGWINSLAEVLGGRLEVPIFGLGGILFAHVILDGAFAARLLLARLDSIPAPRLKTGQSLGLSAAQRFITIDWPALAGTLPGLAAIIFLLAFTSFPIVLLLGGGPANQTLEVAIYAAVRLDFDLPAAVELALVQVAACAAVILASTAFAPIPSSPGGVGGGRHHWADRGGALVLQWAILGLAVVGFALPLLAVLAGFFEGAGALFARPAFWRAASHSLAIATPASRPISGHSTAANCRHPESPSERISRPCPRPIASSGGPRAATAKGRLRRLLATITTAGPARSGAMPSPRTKRKKPSASTTAGTAR